MSEVKDVIVQGLWKNNSALVQLLGMCPLLAVTSTATNALGLGLATTLVLTLTNLTISSLRRWTPAEIRIPIYVMIIASVVSIVQMLINAYAFGLYQSLGIFIPLIVTNCIVVGRAEAFAAKKGPALSALDGFAIGMGATCTMFVLGSIRELLGNGTLFDGADGLLGSWAKSLRVELFHTDTPFLLAMLPPGAFIGLGMLLAINPQNLGGLLNFPLTETLAAITGLPTLAVNDAQAAAWAEFHALGGDYRDMVFLTVSTGVGGGVVLDGKLVCGSGGLAGHLGHTLADPDGPMCGCGRRGCVEAIASGRGIAAAAQGELAGCDAKAIFLRAGEGNEQAAQLIHRSAQTLARLIADVKATTDCQCVVIGGSVGLAEGYLALVEHYLAQEPWAYHVELLAAHYRHDAGLLGAALLAQGD